MKVNIYGLPETRYMAVQKGRKAFLEFGMAALLREELNSHKNLYTLPIAVCSVYIFSCRK